MDDDTVFPAVGHKYEVKFTADDGIEGFAVQLQFHSPTSLTYAGVRPNGTLGASETVQIRVEPVRDLLFLVTWQEQDGTTVVHLEDYKNLAITTHVTSQPAGGADPDFSIFHGSMTRLS
jgi:hypothetical protein